MTNRIAFILTISLSFLFGVDRPKEIETLFQTATGIQFNTEVFQQNQLIKKGVIQNYKQGRKSKSIPKPAGSPIYISNQKSGNTLKKETLGKKILVDELIERSEEYRRKKNMSERDKEAFAPMGHSQQPKTNRVDYKQKLNELRTHAKAGNTPVTHEAMRKIKLDHQTSTRSRSRSTGTEFYFETVAGLYEVFGDVLATEGSGCDGCPGNLDEMEVETSFPIFRQDSFEAWASESNFLSIYFQFIDENESGEYDDGEIYAVSCEDSEISNNKTVAYNGSVYDLDFVEFWMEAYDFDWNNDDEDDFSITFDDGTTASYDLHLDDGLLELEGFEGGVYYNVHEATITLSDGTVIEAGSECDSTSRDHGAGRVAWDGQMLTSNVYDSDCNEFAFDVMQPNVDMTEFMSNGGDVDFLEGYYYGSWGQGGTSASASLYLESDPMDDGMVSGGVYDSEGNPVDSCEIWLFSEDGVEAIVLSDLGGFYSAELPPGHYSAFADPWPDSTFWPSFWDGGVFHLEESAEVVIDFELFPRDEFAWVLAQLQTEMAYVEINDASGDIFYAGYTNWWFYAGGTVPPGDYDVHVWVDDQYEYQSVSAEAGSDYFLEFDIGGGDDGWIEGHVWDQDGNGIEDAWVSAWGNSGDWSTNTGPDGYYSLNEMPPGEYEMTASADGFFDSNSGGIEVFQNEGTYIDFFLQQEDQESGTVHAYVYDHEGNPNDSATVSFFNGDIWLDFGVDEYGEAVAELPSGPWSAFGSDSDTTTYFDLWDGGVVHVENGSNDFVELFLYPREEYGFVIAHVYTMINDSTQEYLDAYVIIEDNEGSIHFEGHTNVYGDIGDPLPPGDDYLVRVETEYGYQEQYISVDENSINFVSFLFGGEFDGNILVNSGFEEGSDENGNNPNGWEIWPGELNHLVFQTGSEMFGNSEYTFEAFEGDYSLLIWGLYNGEANNNNVFQTWYNGELEPGTEFHVDAHMMTDQYNSLSQGGNFAVLFASYFDPDFSWIGHETSAQFDGTYPDNDWHHFAFNGIVPEGTHIVQIGVGFVQPDDNSHGTVYVDNLRAHIDQGEEPPPDPALYGTWMMAPEANALMVGPNPFDGSWWSNSQDDVDTRWCYFDDRYIFDEDGFHNDLDDETWLEWWQGADPEGCGFPVYPHDGSNNPAGYDFGGGTLTLHGLGAYIGLPKAANGFELTSPDEAPESVTYEVSFSYDGEIMYLVIEAGEGVFWTFKLIREDDEGDFTFLGEFDGSEYYLSDYADTWTNANEWLQSLQIPEIHLVTIGSQQENDFLVDVYNEDEFWIGFTDQDEEGNWQWVTGEEVVYTNWFDGEPNNSEGIQHYGISNFSEPGFWDDSENDIWRRFIVEVEETSESATILDVSDVPDDQGGRVYVKFSRSVHDTDPLRDVEMYTVERLDGNTWVGLNSVSAYGNDEYVVEATTLADSTSENDAIMTYRIIAAMEEGNFASEPESGYSVDNIAPGAPTGVVAGISDGVVYLEWAPSDANDLDYYAVYRSTDPEFLPGEENMIGSSEGSDFADDVEELGDYYYAVTAFDIHENESDPSELVNVTLLSLEDIHGLPEVFTLHQNYPNPFNPNTQIQYALPTDANVSIVIYDLMGRQIRTLVNQQISAGYHSVMWNATSDMGSPVSAGVYIYTITANDFRDVKKMILLK